MSRVRLCVFSRDLLLLDARELPGSSLGGQRKVRGRSELRASIGKAEMVTCSASGRAAHEYGHFGGRSGWMPCNVRRTAGALCREAMGLEFGIGLSPA